MTWKGIVNRGFSNVEFDVYCRGLQWSTWRPSFVVLHNTAIPTLTQRPTGFSSANMLALQDYYRDQLGWSAGPHLFVDDQQIWVFTPLTTPGVHSPSWNQISLGIEMLGDYASESFTTGRGLAVCRNTQAAMATLCGVIGLQPDTMRLHREDPKTTHLCPGSGVDKADVIRGVQLLVAANDGGEHMQATAAAPAA